MTDKRSRVFTASKAAGWVRIGTASRNPFHSGSCPWNETSL